ncbi:GATA transcription factor 18-like [Neltuma alba]|uniref:GATA transcription factor 18-like n=1 Tax=Neltuma alba TaxID=207710 RepID=UPI0010A3CDDC|nr:GATA transcription factor 18-like [Prosopis alba]
MDFQKLKQLLVDDGSSSSSSSKKKVDGVRGPNKQLDLNLLPEDSEEERDDGDGDDEFYIEIFGSVGTPQAALNQTDNEVDANSNSNGFVLPPFPASGDNNDASMFNNTTASSTTKMVTPSHPFDDKRRAHHNDGSSTSSGTPRSLRPRRAPEANCDRRICTNYNCRTRNTPMWRRGPLGPKTLCNACGIQYKKQVSSRGSDLL